MKTDTDNISINISEENDTPTNTIPGDQTIEAGDTLSFSTANGNSIRISDIDDNGSSVKVELAVDNGSLDLTDVTGLSFQSGDGTNDVAMVFEGSIADINNALEGLRYTPGADFTGTSVLTIVTNDQGNTGAGGAMTDTDNVTINISAVSNLAPSIDNEPVATKSDTPTEDYTIAPVMPSETINPIEQDDNPVVEMTEESNENDNPSDIVINVDAEGKPTVQLKQGSSELLHSLINNPLNVEASNVTTISLENRANEQYINFESVSPWKLDSQLTGNELQMAIDELNQQLGSSGRAEQDGEQIIVSTVSGISIALTAGFVTWALQGGSLLTALMTVLPVWNTFDPLPVLNANADKQNTSSKNKKDEIDSVFDKTAPVTAD